MAYVTLCNEVIFIEGENPRAVKRCGAQTRVGGFGAHLKNLDDLKRVMAQTAKMNGCNCVVNFTYGQKTKIIAIDDVAFVGDGFYAVLSPQDYNSIVSQLI
ncbi:MAG: hypothetical protein PHD46_04970 [Eubacteriales bacterium]|nr:hypothetical protein [Eubacteriales bacterium]MDD4422368.1 hypothetical protein [Eubacteriales bacterium]HBR31901.1 hypothetical protein [Clostridiales bacterium]